MTVAAHDRQRVISGEKAHRQKRPAPAHGALPDTDAPFVDRLSPVSQVPVCRLQPIRVQVPLLRNFAFGLAVANCLLLLVNTTARFQSVGVWLLS